MATSLRTPGLLRVTVAANPHVVPTPTSFASGDVLLLFSNVDSKSTTITDPTGWTLLDDIQTSVALGNRCRVWIRVADGTEGSSVSLSLSVAKLGSACMHGVVGAVQSTTPNSHSTRDNPTSSTSQAAPSVTPSADDCVWFTYHAGFFNGSWTPPAGMTEDADQANSDTTMEVNHIQLVGQNGVAQGTRNATSSSSVASICGSVLIAPLATATVNPIDPLIYVPQFTYVRL